MHTLVSEDKTQLKDQTEISPLKNSKSNIRNSSDIATMRLTSLQLRIRQLEEENCALRNKLFSKKPHCEICEKLLVCEACEKTKKKPLPQAPEDEDVQIVPRESEYFFRDSIVKK